MNSIVILGSCPSRILSKADELLALFKDGNAKCKKIAGLRQYISIKLNHNYRLIVSRTGVAYVGSHDLYEKKIKQLRKYG